MKRAFSIGLMCFMVLLCSAQHYMGVGIAADVPLSLNNLLFAHPTIGMGGEFSGVYVLKYRHFMLQTGVDIGAQLPRLRLEDQMLEQPMIDTRGVPFIYRGSLVSRVDESRQFGVGIPLMMGFANDFMYVIAGARFYQIVSAQYYTTAKLQTVGDYEGRYYDFFEDMPNHGYHDYEPVSSNGSMKYRYDVQVCAEIGGRIPLHVGYSSHRPMLHVGVWAAYGLLDSNANSEATLRLTEPDYTQFMQVNMTHPYCSVDGSGADVHNLCVGIKASVLFGLSGEIKRKHACRCSGMY